MSKDSIFMKTKITLYILIFIGFSEQGSIGTRTNYSALFSGNGIKYSLLASVNILVTPWIENEKVNGILNLEIDIAELNFVSNGLGSERRKRRRNEEYLGIITDSNNKGDLSNFIEEEIRENETFSVLNKLPEITKVITIIKLKLDLSKYDLNEDSDDLFFIKIVFFIFIENGMVIVSDEIEDYMNEVFIVECSFTFSKVIGTYGGELITLYTFENSHYEVNFSSHDSEEEEDEEGKEDETLSAKNFKGIDLVVFYTQLRKEYSKNPNKATVLINLESEMGKENK